MTSDSTRIGPNGDDLAVATASTPSTSFALVRAGGDARTGEGGRASEHEGDSRASGHDGEVLLATGTNGVEPSDVDAAVEALDLGSDDAVVCQAISSGRDPVSFDEDTLESVGEMYVPPGSEGRLDDRTAEAVTTLDEARPVGDLLVTPAYEGPGSMSVEAAHGDASVVAAEHSLDDHESLPTLPDVFLTTNGSYRHREYVRHQRPHVTHRQGGATAMGHRVSSVAAAGSSVASVEGIDGGCGYHVSEDGVAVARESGRDSSVHVAVGDESLSFDREALDGPREVASRLRKLVGAAKAKDPEAVVDRPDGLVDRCQAEYLDVDALDAVDDREPTQDAERWTTSDRR